MAGGGGGGGTVNRLHDCSPDNVVDYVPERELNTRALSNVYVYMKSATGGAPYVCKDCDNKTTVGYMFLGHRQTHRQSLVIK